MKIRILTGLACTIAVVSILVFTGLGYPGVMSIPMGVISAIAAYEMMRVSKCQNKVLTGVSMVIAGLAPVYTDFNIKQFIPVPESVLLTAYIILLLLILLKGYEKTKFEHVALAVFGSLIIPGSLSTFFKVRDLCEVYPEYFQLSHCMCFILCAMFCAWMCDTWAYFVGSRFGKHKLSPKISPKKSVEGAIGGVVGAIVFCGGTYLVCDRFFFHLDTVKLWMVVAATIVVSILGMCGDLSASVIKRNFGEKDFGTLFPGHGGVLDRIDSYLVTMPAVYAILQIGVALADK